MDNKCSAAKTFPFATTWKPAIETFPPTTLIQGSHDKIMNPITGLYIVLRLRISRILPSLSPTFSWHGTQVQRQFYPLTWNILWEEEKKEIFY
jgi:hypothetical protein